jgi:hypothetical protein
MALDRIPDIGTLATAQEVSDTLNYYGGDTTGADGSTLFSIGANINPFSRRKPIVDAEGVRSYPARKFFISTAEMAKQYTSGGAVKSRYGLAMLGGNIAPSLVYLLAKNNGDVGFQYELPPRSSLDVLKPKRLSDFNGYNPEAQCPLRTTFADGWKFPYVATDYQLNGIELAEGKDPGQLYRVDIYPTEDVNGNAEDMRRGVYVRFLDGSYDFTVVGAIKFNSDRFVQAALSKLAGKTFEIFEFITNAPETWNSFVSLDDFAASGYYCYALPYPIVTCSMQASGGGGVTPTYEIARVVFTTSPIFRQFNSADYSTVVAGFKISSRGTQYQGGKVTGIVCGIYSDAACNYPIARTYFDDITLGADADSPTYSVRLANSTGSSGIYFGVWFNNKLQYSGIPKVSVATIQED